MPSGNQIARAKAGTAWEAGMPAEIWLPWLAIGFLASIGVSVEALIRGSEARRSWRALGERFGGLETRLAGLDQRLRAIETAGAPPAAPVDQAAPEPEPAPAPAIATPPPAPEPSPPAAP